MSAEQAILPQPIIQQQTQENSSKNPKIDKNRISAMIIAAAIGDAMGAPS